MSKLRNRVEIAGLVAAGPYLLDPKRRFGSLSLLIDTEHGRGVVPVEVSGYDDVFESLGVNDTVGVVGELEPGTGSRAGVRIVASKVVLVERSDD